MRPPTFPEPTTAVLSTAVKLATIGAFHGGPDTQGVSGGTSFTGTTFVLANNGIPTVANLQATKRLDWLSAVPGRLGWLAAPTLPLFMEPAVSLEASFGLAEGSDAGRPSGESVGDGRAASCKLLRDLETQKM